MKRLFLLLLIGVNCFSNVFAQEKDTLKAGDIIKMSFTDLMNTKVISASKVQQEIKDVSATVQVITSEQIKDRGYFTLEEALSDLPGFQFRNINGFNSYVFMRGAPSQNNLILLLVDGVQINELNSGGFYAGGQFNMSTIERIEVVYGPSSTLYGTNAVSGIINIITKSSNWGKKGSISMLGGTFNTGMLDFNIRNYDDENKVSYAVSGMYKVSEKADLHGINGDNNWTNEMENFENDLSLSAKIKIKKFSAGVIFQNKQSSMTTNFKSVNDNYYDRNTLWNISFLNGFVKYTNNTNNRITYNSTLYYRNATVNPNSVNNIIKATDTTSGNQVGYYRPNHMTGFDNQIILKPVEKLILTGGITGEIEKLSKGFSISNSNSQFIPPSPPAKPDMLENRLFSYYLQFSYSLFNKLSLVGGIRHDFSSYYGQVLTPRAGLVFNTSKFTAKFMYNRAFRAPKPWDYGYGSGNVSLKPEKMHSFELFTSYSVLKNFSLGASLYRNLINDKLVLDYSGNGVRWVNESKLNTYGFEFYSNYSTKSLSLYANYTYTNSYEQDGIIIPEISMHTANAGITYAFTPHIRANLRANYLGGRNNPMLIPSTGSYKIDGAFLLHGAISYNDFYGFDIQLKVNNFFNEVYYHPSNRFAGRYRQPQRSVMLMITYNLFR